MLSGEETYTNITVFDLRQPPGSKHILLNNLQTVILQIKKEKNCRRRSKMKNLCLIRLLL